MSELTTVADNLAVVHDGPEVRRYEELAPDRGHRYDGHEFRTLPAAGELLCRVATVNDVHFGEEVCGLLDGAGDPVFRSEPGADPYPEVMNRAVIAEMAAIDPAAVVAKGDLTTTGVASEYDAFVAHYGGAFGDRLHAVRGNHDAYQGEEFAAEAPVRVDLPGVILAVLDTVIPTRTPGRVTNGQLDWLDALAAAADRPVLVFGHHHPWNPDSSVRPADYFGINPDDSEALVALVARRPRIVGYFAGHTHRNRVRYFSATGPVPWAEVACVKDFPGSWAEYRVFEGGVLQIHHRASSPEALAWTDKTRGMFDGAYPEYAFGALDDRCFALPGR